MQQGHLPVVEELLNCPRVTLYHTPKDPAMIAMWKAMGADTDALYQCDCAAAFECLLAGGGENRLEVLRRCVKDERIRRFLFDPEMQAMLPLSMRGCRPALS